MFPGKHTHIEKATKVCTTEFQFTCQEDPNPEQAHTCRGAPFVRITHQCAHQLLQPWQSAHQAIDATPRPRFQLWQPPGALCGWLPLCEIFLHEAIIGIWLAHPNAIQMAHPANPIFREVHHAIRPILSMFEGGALLEMVSLTPLLHRLTRRIAP